MLRRVVGVLDVVRQAPAGERTGFVVTEVQKFAIPLWPPGKAIDAVKTENVVDAEDVKNFGQLLHPALPPAEALGLHHIPAIEGNAPVLAPTLHKVVVFKIGLGWSTTTPLQIKLLWLEKHICTAPGNTKGHISHELHFFLCGIGSHGTPLTEAKPLHVSVKLQLFCDLRRVKTALLHQPSFRFGTAIDLLRPVRPVFMSVEIHQHAEETEFLKPGAFRSAKSSKLGRTLRKCR